MIVEETSRLQNASLDEVGIIGKVLFFWVSPMITLGFRQPLQAGEYCRLPADLHPQPVFSRFQRELDERRKALDAAGKANKGPKKLILGAFIGALGRYLRIAVGLQICAVLCKFACVLLLRRLMMIVTASGEIQTAEGLGCAFGLFACNVIDGMCFSLATQHLQLALYGMLSCVSQAVLWKGSVLHPALHDTNRRGALVTLAISDFQRIIEMSGILMNGIGAPIMLLVAFPVLIAILGPIVLVDILVVIGAIFAIGKVGKTQGNSFRNKMMGQGQRVGVLNEMLQSVRFTKFYMLEEQYGNKMLEARNKELKWLWWMKTALGMNWPVASCVPALTVVVIFSMHIAIEGGLPSSPDTIAVLAVARFLFLPFAFFGGFLGCVNMFMSVLARLSMLLTRDEIKRQPYPNDAETNGTDVKQQTATNAADSEQLALCMQNQSSTWSLPPADNSDGKQPTPELDSINLRIPHGELWAVVGELGSGKSTLLASILGGLSPVGSDGSLTVNATSRTYVAQEPMVMNATVRDNILFGSALGAESQEMYDRAIYAAALQPDLEILPAEDLTEIGEKGLTLSGGQKARVALARAIYHSRPGGLVLLDDPLAAVDAHVGTHIFEECILGAFAETTRILVTNQLHFLQNRGVAQILVMAEGRIVEQGTFEELAARPDGVFTKMMQSNGTKVEVKKVEDEKRSSQMARGATARRSFCLSDKLGDAAEMGAKGQLVKKESKREGAVTLASFMFFFRAMGGLHVFIFCFFSAWFFHLTELLPDIWLVMWQEDAMGKDQTFYVCIWLAIVFGGIAMFVTERFIWIGATMRAARTIYSKMSEQVLYCPIFFFDRTPSGRIMNRLGEDQMLVDFTIGVNLEVLSIICWQVLDQLGIVIAAKPLVVPAIVILLGLLACAREVHRRAVREAMRWYLVTKSPVFNIFEEVLSGSNTIYAFGRERFFAERFEKALLENNQWLLSKDACNNWAMLRTSIMGAILSATLAAQMVLLPDSGSSIFAGTAMIYSLQIGIALQTLLYFFVQVEGVFASIERVLEFTKLKQEPPRHLTTDDSLLASAWPGQDFTLELKEVCVRYEAQLPLALNRLSATIHAREKIGIVGRTGCGKSTFFGALFRLFELEEGQIILGGQNIAALGTGTLRQQLTMVPQDPVLFSGELRKNLDPLAAHTDEALWKVLKRCSISDLVAGMQGGLTGSVSEGGSNFSVGERQVLCLARALLRNAPVLCLDEATANVDPQNDQRIQEILTTEVKDLMVLTIAHRLHTVIRSDRIMVLDAGKLAQFDSPDTLLRTEGIFKDLASQAGLASAEPESREHMESI